MIAELVKAAAPIRWEQQLGYVGMCEHIAKCAAICYNSQPKTGKKAVEFVKALAKNGHGRALEFGTIGITVPRATLRADPSLYDRLCEMNPSHYYSALEFREVMYISTNLRYILEHIDNDLDSIESNWEKERSSGLKIGNCYTGLFNNRVTVYFPCMARSIADEFRTHTALSTMMRSTRYVSPVEKTDDKNFDDHIKFVKPYWYLDEKKGSKEFMFDLAMTQAAQSYGMLLDSKASKQEARDILPLSIATEMVMCGFDEHWQNFIKLRKATSAHPDARILATQIDKLINS